MKTTFLLPTLLVAAPGLAAHLAPTTAGSDTGPAIREEIVVTATRSPYSLLDVPVSLRVVSASDIARSGATSVDQLLRGEGTLQVRDSLGNGRNVSISIRGFAAGQNALVLVDGRRINNSDLSEPDLTVVALKDVERIEILEGGAGVLFGDQAVGGVVNIITRSDLKPGGAVAVGYGSYDNRDVQLAYEGALTDNLDYRLSGQHQAANGYRDDTDIAYRHYRGDLSYRYGRGSRVFAELQTSDNDYFLPGSLAPVELRADRRQVGGSYNDYNVTTDSVRLGIDQRLGDNNRVLAAFADRDESVFILGRSLSFGDSVTRQQRRVETWDPRLVVNAGPARLTLGTDLENYDYDLAVDSVYGLSTSEHRHRRRSEYAQVIAPADQALQFSAGYRHAAVDVDVDGGYFRTGYDASLSVQQLGFSWRASENLRFYGNRDETFRFPLPDENVDFLGNVVALRPQRGVALELGGQWQGSAVGVSAVLFHHAIEDEIGYDSATFSNVNFDDSRRVGGSLDIDWQLTSDWRLAVSLSRFSAEFTDGDAQGRRLPGVAEKLARLVFEYAVTESANIYGELLYTGPLALDLGADSPVLGGYSVCNLAASYGWHNWSARVRLNNVTGKQYSELVTYYGTPAYYPSPEANANLSLEYRFQ